MPSNTPLVNGVSYAWVNISVILFGVPLIGITAIDYKRKQNKVNNWGKGKKPVSRSYGREDYEASISLFTETWKEIIAGSPNRNPLEVPWFDIPVLFGGEGVETTKDVLQAAEFMEDPLEGKEGDTSLIVKIPLIIGGISR